MSKGSTCGHCGSSTVRLSFSRLDGDGQRVRRWVCGDCDRASSTFEISEKTMLELENLRALINTPEISDFAAGIQLEAAHQRHRWGADHDVGKAPEDWFWLLGYLAGKALHAAKSGDTGKAKHHTISSAAALANWHSALSGAANRMRPGIDPIERYGNE